jgi:hypothetical protein
LRRIDARIRHEPTVSVIVSGRTEGRAVGGMADTIRRRIIEQDEFTDATIEPAADRARRMRLRVSARRVWASGADGCGLAGHLRLTIDELRHAMTQPYFGAAWATLEAVSPILLQRRVRFADLVTEILNAEKELVSLHRLAARPLALATV